jgi:hypothetical protein
MHEDILCLHEPKRKVERDENDDDMMRFAVLRHVHCKRDFYDTGSFLLAFFP